MRLSAWIFILLFTFNLVAETVHGDCAEFSPAQSASALTADAGQLPSHEPCGQSCHLGHCGHVILPAPVAKLNFGLPKRFYYFSPTSFVWRPLAPLFKPPIV